MYITPAQYIDGPPFLVILVDAPHFDYSSNRSLCRSIAKHPGSGSKSGDVGHAWIYLQGCCIDGKWVVIEGGHSGERGVVQAKYFEGIMNYIEYGYANPTQEQMDCPVYEPNPIKYLWEVQNDGFFQRGSGKHRPTYAVKVDLTDEQFKSILEFINPSHYNYQEYSLTDHQCTTFAVQVAQLAGLNLEYEMSLAIGQTLKAGKDTFVLWTDPQYSMLEFASPDILECSMKRAAMEGRADEALDWYLTHFAPPLSEKIEGAWESIVRFPERFYRILLF